MPRPNVRRAASKEALKQMQLLSASVFDDDDTTETFEIASEDDDDNVRGTNMPPKKKYKLSHRKSSDGNDRDVMVLKTVSSDDINTLQLDSWTEELTESQLNLKRKADKEVKTLNTQIEHLVKAQNAEVIFQGEYCNVLQFDNTQPTPNTISTVIPTSTSQLEATKRMMAKNPPPRNLVLQQPPTTTTNSNALQLVMDPRLGVIVGTMTPAAPATATSITPTAPSPQITTSNTSTTPVTRGRRRGRNSVQIPQVLPTPSPKVQQNLAKLQKAANQSSSARPSENTSVGGLSALTNANKNTNATTKVTNIVDLTRDDGGKPTTADTREVAFNKLQGKTFPSLVVVARPHLNFNESSTSDRPKLDSKVKTVLMCLPTKFTEWLIQQGLIKSEQNCVNHSNSKMKLGMYSDVSKFPYSGGYVWISECCPHRFVSVFSGSLFEAAPHPPTVLLKLIYHWACQTNVQNVVQWVKVDNSYVKGIYAWLRALCTVALHTHVGRLGGIGVKVEVGVISLGTTSHDGKERKVKVEVLGILEPLAKRIRLRAVEPLADGECDYKKRFAKILEPLSQWVHPESIIITDLTVDKSTLHNMGFMRVVQYPASDRNPSNYQIMEYLRKIVPRMFQNTLSLLSRQIIQQFLDELVWREWFGHTVGECFDNILSHMAEQTRYDATPTQSLIVRLNKVTTNPFKNWSIKNSFVSSNPIILNKSLPANTNSQPSIQSTAKRTSTRQRKINVRSLSPPVSDSPPPQIIQQRTQRAISPDLPEQMVPLENYYYGTIEGMGTDVKAAWNIKCSMCKMYYSNNLQLMSHLFSHAHSLTAGLHQCRYCLSSVASQEGLSKHIATSHPLETRVGESYICIICETRFSNGLLLGRHMSKEHVPAELPYKCNTCNHRSSSHRHAIDHFYKVHDNGAHIQCPFCLKSMSVWSGGRATPQNLNFFLQHLQKHQKKAMAKKCSKCALWFIHKDTLKEHQINMHSSQRRKPGLLSWPVPRNVLMVPKSKQDKQIWEDSEREFSISNLRIDALYKMVCKECKTSVNSAQHYKVLEGCSRRNCQYLTCCMKAMESHERICTQLNQSLPEHPLKKQMHCVCGFSVNDGNLLAKHLAECERKSAYPSADAAKSAIKAHSMLDVLGLVRRPEEPRKENLKQGIKRPRAILEDSVISLDDDEDNIEETNKSTGVEKSARKDNGNYKTKVKKPNLDKSVRDSDVKNVDNSKLSETVKLDIVDAVSEKSSVEKNDLENVEKDKNVEENPKIYVKDVHSNSENVGKVVEEKNSDSNNDSENQGNKTDVEDKSHDDNVNKTNVEDSSNDDNVNKTNVEDFSNDENVKKINVEDSSSDGNVKKTDVEDTSNDENVNQTNVENSSSDGNVNKTDVKDTSNDENVKTNVEDSSSDGNVNKTDVGTNKDDNNCNTINNDTENINTSTQNNEFAANQSVTDEHATEITEPTNEKSSEQLTENKKNAVIESSEKMECDIPETDKEKEETSAINDDAREIDNVISHDSNIETENKIGDSGLEANIKENIQNIEKLFGTSVIPEDLNHATDLISEVTESNSNDIKDKGTNNLDANKMIADEESVSNTPNNMNADDNLAEHNPVSVDAVSNLNFDAITELMETDGK